MLFAGELQGVGQVLSGFAGGRVAFDFEGGADDAVIVGFFDVIFDRHARVTAEKANEGDGRTVGIVVADGDFLDVFDDLVFFPASGLVQAVHGMVIEVLAKRFGLRIKVDENLPVLIDVLESFPVPGEGCGAAGDQRFFDVEADEFDFVVEDGSDLIFGTGRLFEQVLFDLGPLLLGKDGDGFFDFLAAGLGGEREGRSKGNCRKRESF